MSGLACGIDVGGTKIAGGVVDEQGVVIEELTVESPAEDVEAIEQAIAGLVDELRSRHEITCVGVGAAGHVSNTRSQVYFAPNLAWRDLDLQADLQERIDLRVVIENDANAAAWGEFSFGAGKAVDDFLLVTVGTGVGGGIVLNGTLHRGGFGVAGEIGHLRMVPGGIRCGCGNLGCLESYGSGTALVREARAAVRAASRTAGDLWERAGGDPDAIEGQMITASARAGDQFAIDQLAGIGTWLGEGIASLAAVLDPAMVAIGGGVSEAGELLLGPIRTAFERELTGRGHRPTASITLAELGNKAGLIGAADLARRP